VTIYSWHSSISGYVTTIATYSESATEIIEWTTVTISTTTTFWSSTLGTYDRKPVEVRAIVPKWVPMKWEKETVYHTVQVYSPTLGHSVSVVYSYVATVAVIPSNQGSEIHTVAPSGANAAILFSEMND